MSTDLLAHVETRIRTIVLEQLPAKMAGSREIDANTPILGAGLEFDSLEALALVVEIEAEFDILIEDEDLTVALFENIGTLAAHVKGKLSMTDFQER